MCEDLVKNLLRLYHRKRWEPGRCIRSRGYGRNTLVTSNRAFRSMIRESGARCRGLQEGYGVRRQEMVLAQVLVRSLHPGREERIKPLRDGLLILTLILVHASHVGLFAVLEGRRRSKGC